MSHAEILAENIVIRSLKNELSFLRKKVAALEEYYAACNDLRVYPTGVLQRERRARIDRARLAVEAI